MTSNHPHVVRWLWCEGCGKRYTWRRSGCPKRCGAKRYYCESGRKPTHGKKK